jgi:hypothetical protein
MVAARIACTKELGTLALKGGFLTRVIKGEDSFFFIYPFTPSPMGPDWLQ